MKHVREIWISKDDAESEEPTVLMSKPAETIHWIKGLLTYDVYEYELRLKLTSPSRNGRWYLSNNSDSTRLKYVDFIRIVRALVAVKSNQASLDWDVCGGQPVWVFNKAPSELAKQIKEIDDRIDVRICVK